MVIVLEDRLIQCGHCRGKGKAIVGVGPLPYRKWKKKKCYECKGSGWEGIEKVEVVRFGLSVANEIWYSELLRYTYADLPD